MDLRLSAEDLAFKDEVRAFIRATLPAELARRMRAGGKAGPDELRDWTRALAARGWSVPHWPVEWGGTGWSPLRQMIFRDEIQQYPAPETLSFGTSMVGPVIYTFGSQAQKERFLPRIARLDDWWCQGFSEPGAGSDLASLRTRAEPVEGGWHITGQKAWTSLGQHANWIFVLARTDRTARKQNGISFFLVPMDAPGITVQPTALIDGSHEVNEVFFDDVFVPAENLVGEVNKGWDYARFLLSNERTGQARVGLSKARLRRIRELAESPPQGGPVPLDHPAFHRRLVELEVQALALETTILRVVAASSGGEGEANPVSSILKVRGSELQQDTAELLLEVAGPAACVWPIEPDDGAPLWGADAAPTYFNLRKLSIYGGSNEIQRTIIARSILGL
ncbi:MAG: acyl-CoA dehydrogenase family protein [Rhodobiaceae bacterium]|nr:acyl-CoA dehydrogenase family protein [Rhodobiaceae bacterium]MCC0042648.1 acyl-CoA dehydrogenase family protein [Rhodobiaceae bacterium]